MLLKHSVLQNEVNKKAMVILNVPAWQGDTEQTPPKPVLDVDPVKEIEMFGFQDLTSDYYQVYYIFGYLIIVKR